MSDLESDAYSLHESGKVSKSRLFHYANGEFDWTERVELTPEQLQGVNINWEAGRVRRTAENKEPVKMYYSSENYLNLFGPKPVKKGKAETVIHTVAEFGKKIVPPELRDGK